MDHERVQLYASRNWPSLLVRVESTRYTSRLVPGMVSILVLVFQVYDPSLFAPFEIKRCIEPFQHTAPPCATVACPNAHRTSAHLITPTFFAKLLSFCHPYLCNKLCNAAAKAALLLLLSSLSQASAKNHS